MLAVLIMAGCLFPLIAWSTFAMSWYAAVREKRHVSGVYIPFAGPLLLDAALARSSMPGWTMLLPWVFDLGTVMFFFALPTMAAHMWQTSRFTRLFTFTGDNGSARVALSFHRGGHYLLTIAWHHAPGTVGPIRLGEPGTYTREPDGTFILRCGDERTRTIVAEGTGHRVIDGGAAGYSQLDGWRLSGAPDTRRS